MHKYQWQTDPPPPIEHRSLQMHYTRYISDIAQCTNTHGSVTPQLSIDACNTATPNLAHLMVDLYIYIEQCTFTYGRLTPSNRA